MDKIKYLIIIVLFPIFIFCQGVNGSKSNVALKLGLSRSFLIDEYISPNEYSGYSAIYGLTWGDSNSKRIVQLDIVFNKSSNLKNNLSEANNSLFSFNYRHTFFISESLLFSKQFDLYLGPGLSIFISNRSQKNIPIESAIGFGSLDLNIRADLTISEDLSISSRILFSPILLGNKSKNNVSVNDKNKIDMLTFFGLQNLRYDLICKYKLTSLFNVQAAYCFNLVRSDNWDYYRLIADEILFQFGVSF